MDQVTRVGGPMLSYGDHNVSIPFESEGRLHALSS